MPKTLLEGLGVALVTPFKKDFTIDFDALGKLICHVCEGGADYLVVLGTTGETPTLNFDEREEIAQYVKEKNKGRKPLIIGVGGNCTYRVLKDLEKYDLAGYDAILSVTPYYNKPSQEGLFHHFKSVIDASPLPVLLYNVPGRTGVNMTARTTLRIAEYSNKVIGIKEASGNISQSEMILKEAPAGFNVVSGNDSDTARIMKAGGCGVISVMGNACPEHVKRLVDLCQEKEYDRAEKYQEALNPVIGHLFEDGNPAGVKSLLADMGMMENILRLPLLPVNKEVGAKIERDARNLKNLI